MRSKPLMCDCTYMATALQWHVAHNSEREIVQATERTHNFNAANNVDEGVFIVVCESQVCGQDDPDAASVLASEIFRAYRNAGTRTESTTEEDVAQRVASAVASGIAFASAPENRIVAALVWHYTLFVARSGGHAYLLRQGELQHLTTDEALGDAVALEPEIGQLTLEGEDRILLCTSAVSAVLQPADMRRWLKMHPSGRRTAQMLLRAVEHECPQHMVGLAIIDHIGGNPAAFPTRQSKPTTERSMIALPARIRNVVPLVSVAGAAIVTAAILAAQSRDTHMPPVYAISAVSAVSAVSTLATPGPVMHIQAQTRMLSVGPASVELARASTFGQTRVQPVLTLPTPNRNWQLVSSGLPTARATLIPMQAIEFEQPQQEAQATATPKPVPWMEIRPRAITVMLGEAVQLRATVRNADGSANTQGVVQWQPTEWMTSPDARTGVFNATSAGTYTITAQINNLKAIARVFVLVPITQTIIPTDISSVSATVSSAVESAGAEPTNVPAMPTLQAELTQVPTPEPTPVAPSPTEAPSPEPTPAPTTAPINSPDLVPPLPTVVVPAQPEPPTQTVSP